MLTIKALRAHPRNGAGDRWISDGAVRGSGALWARVGESAVTFYFRYTDSGGKKRALALGGYDEAGLKGLSLTQARDKAGAISKLYREGVRDLHEHLERERGAAERARKAEEEAERRAKEDAQRGTLRQLLAAYVAHLERKGKQSYRDARSIFALHVIEAAPDLADRKASELTVDDLVPLVGKLVEADKGRTASKLRSYMRAAFELALRSKTDPAAPQTLRTFGIVVNPVSSIAALAEFNVARERVLTAPELGAFLRRVEALPDGTKRDALQLCLLLGGQRPAQLLRIKAADIDLDGATVVLWDGKGRRKQERRHELPLVKEAVEILERRLKEPRPENDTVLGERADRLSSYVTDMVGKMLEAGEVREAFQLRDLRRTVETMLASIGVSSDVCAQLLSHGLGGVQQRHYQRHAYTLEKKAALEKWARHMDRVREGKAAEVVALRAAREA